MLVGQADEDVGAEAVERGALDFLIKQQIVSTLLAKALRYATERTHTLLALKASESRYRELYENVVAGVFQTTPDGKFMAANPALVRLLGYASEDELLELSIGEDLYVHAEDRANWLRNMAVGRRDPQCRAGAPAQGRPQDRGAGEFARGARRARAHSLLRRHAHRHHRSARAVAATFV